MAYIAETLVTQSTASATTFDVELPPHVAGDYLLVCGNNTVGSTSITASSGWTVARQGGAASGAQRAFAVWIKAASSSETLTLTGAASSNWNVCAMTVHDADPSTFLDGSAVATYSASPASSPSLTTTSAGCLLVYVFGSTGSGDLRPFADPSQMVPRCRVFDSAGTRQVVVGTAPQVSAGAAPSVSVEGAGAGHSIILAVRNASGGALEQAPSGGYDTVSRLNSTTPSWAALSSVFSGTLGGIGFSSVAPALGTEGQITPPFWGNTLAITSTESTAGLWVGGVLDLPATTDFSGSAFSVFVGSSSSYSSTLQGANGMAVALIDASGNWKAWQVVLPSGITSSSGSTYFLDANSTPYGSSGTLNVSAVTKFAFLRHRRGSSATGQTARLRNLFLLRPAVLAGGGENNPLSTSLLANSVGNFNTVETISLQGSGQLLMRQPVQIGNGGTHPTVFRNSAQSLELPLGYNFAAGRRFWNIGEGQANTVVKAGSSDVISFAGSILATDQRHDFIIDAASSLSASYDFSAFLCVGYRVFWKTGVPCHGIGFSRCYEIDAKAATVEACTIQGSANVGGAAMKIDAGADVLGCTFTKGREAYAIRIPAAGSYDLRGTTFTGYTTDLNVTATTGTVAITLDSGQAIPTYTTAGATVTFSQPLPVVSVKAVIAGGSPLAGARVLLRTAGGTTVLTGLTDAAGEISADWAGSVPVAVSGWVRKGTGSPAYIQGDISGSITASGFAVTVIMQRDD